MYARMVKGQFKPDKFEFVMNTLERDVIPLLQKRAWRQPCRDANSFSNSRVKRP